MRFSSKNSKLYFLSKYLFRGALFFLIVLVGFFFAKEYVHNNLMPYVARAYENSLFFYGLFVFSEVAFGLIPPEFFMMIYILNDISFTLFMMNICLLFVISYAAGILNYFIGRSFSNTFFFKKINEKFLTKYRLYLKKYGGYLVLVGAVTPIPFSAVCMLVGSVDFPVKKFLLLSTSRLLRFVVYGIVLWGLPNFF